jgi:hypothetical protein
MRVSGRAVLALIFRPRSCRPQNEGAESNQNVKECNGVYNARGIEGMSLGLVAVRPEIEVGVRESI